MPEIFPYSSTLPETEVSANRIVRRPPNFSFVGNYEIPQEQLEQRPYNYSWNKPIFSSQSFEIPTGNLEVPQEVVEYNQRREGQFQKQQAKRPTSFFDFVTSDPNILAPEDLGTKFANIGKAAAFNPTGATVMDQGAARRGKTFSLIGNIGSAVMQGARTMLSGYAQQKREQEALDEQYMNYIRTGQSAEQWMKHGGVIKMLEGGGQVVAELEDGEFIRDPQGNVEEVNGNTHEEGGELFNLQIGTEVTSNNTKLGKEGVNKINTLYPGLKLNLSPTDTLADAVRKADARIGIKKKQQDIEYTRSQMDKLNPTDENTYAVNSTYLLNKLQTEQQELEVLEASKRKFLDSVFDYQESQKGNRTPVTDNFFKKGGKISDEHIKLLSKKNGLPEDFNRTYLNRKQQFFIPKMADGGFTPVKNVYEDPSYAHQGFTQVGDFAQTSGKVTKDAFDDRIRETLRIFPQAVNFLDIEKNDAGEITSMKFKNKEAVKGYQEYVNRVYSNIEKYADKNIQDATQREQLKSYVGGLRFDTESPKSVKFTDSIFGDFTSSRSGVGLPLVTEKELENLKSKGITNFSQIFDPQGNIKDLGLSESSAAKLKGLYSEYGTDFEAEILGMPEQQLAEKAPVVVQEKEQASQQPTEAQKTGQDTGDFKKTGQKAPFRMPFLPDQYRYDYDALESHLMQTPRFGRLSATRVSPDAAVQEAYNAFDAGTRTTAGYADPQRLSVLSSMVAGTQSAISQAILDAETKNTANQQAVDQFNIAQGDREEAGRLGERREYEKLQLTAKAITDKNNEIIANHNRRVTLQNFDVVNRMRLAHNLNPHYGIDETGQVRFVPYTGQRIEIAQPAGYVQDALKQKEYIEQSRLAQQRKISQQTKTKKA